MAAYRLSVFYPLAASSAAATLVHVFALDVDQPLQWMRDHADELAARLTADYEPRRTYHALQLETITT